MIGPRTKDEAAATELGRLYASEEGQKMQRILGLELTPKAHEHIRRAEVIARARGLNLRKPDDKTAEVWVEALT